MNKKMGFLISICALALLSACGTSSDSSSDTTIATTTTSASSETTTSITDSTSDISDSSDKINSEYDSENAVTVTDGKITFTATNSPKNAEMTDANTFVTKDGILSVSIDCEIKDGKIYTTATFTNLTNKDISIDTSLAPGVVSEYGDNGITGAMAAPNTIEANGTYTTSFEEEVPEDNYNLIYKFGRSSSNNTDSLFYMDIINT